MQTVVVLSFSNLASDPRVNRQIRWLSKHYRVIAVGLADPAIAGVSFVGCRLRESVGMNRVLRLSKLALKRFESYYWAQPHVQECLQKLANVQADVVVANDVDTLPLALKVANGARVVFDAHEYAPREYEDRWTWRLAHQGYKKYLCRRYLPKADGMVTVCQSIAEEYARHYPVQPLVITNAPRYFELEPATCQDARIRLIHHGTANRSRKLENMIDAFLRLDERFELDFMVLPQDEAYLAQLKQMAHGHARIRFLDPVPMQEIVPFTAQYDLGFFLLEPTNFNYAHALPNKFFEFIQARLGLAIGPSPEMARIVNQEGLGVVATDFTPEAMAAALQPLDASRIQRFKEQAHRVAKAFSAEQNETRFLGLVQKVMEQ